MSLIAIACGYHRTHEIECATCRHAQVMNALTSISFAIQTIADNQLTNHQEIKMLVQEALDAIDVETNTIADEQIKLGDRVAALIAQLGVLTPAQEAEVVAIKAHQSTLVTALQTLATDPANPVPNPVPPAPPVATP